MKLDYSTLDVCKVGKIIFRKLWQILEVNKEVQGKSRKFFLDILGLKVLEILGRFEYTYCRLETYSTCAVSILETLCSEYHLLWRFKPAGMCSQRPRWQFWIQTTQKVLFWWLIPQSLPKVSKIWVNIWHLS